MAVSTLNFPQADPPAEPVADTNADPPAVGPDRAPRKSGYSNQSIGAELLRRQGVARRALEERRVARELGIDD